MEHRTRNKEQGGRGSSLRGCSLCLLRGCTLVIMTRRAAVAAEIDAILHPGSIAVVGASATPDTPGYAYVRSLQAFGYHGRIHLGNAKGGDSLGVPVYA